MKYLTASEVAVIHARLIQRTGGSKGIRDIGLLESAVARPQATFDQKELYPTLWEKATALMESLISNHAFVDGNKRVGVVAGGLFLERNGGTITASNEEVVEFTMKIAQGEMGLKEIAQGLKAMASYEKGEPNPGSH